MRPGIFGRLVGGFAASVLLLAAVTAIGIKGMADLQADTQTIANQDLQGLYYAQGSQDAITDVDRDMLKAANDSVVEPTLAGDREAAAAADQLNALVARFRVDTGHAPHAVSALVPLQRAA